MVKKPRFNPTALIYAIFLIVPGLILGQIVGISISLNYALYFTLGSGVLFGFLGYKTSMNIDHNLSKFYRLLAVALWTALGCLWSGAFCGPFLFLFAAVLPINLLLLLCVAAGGLFFGLVAFGILKLLEHKTGSNGPNAVTLVSTMFTNMILFASLGMSLLGPGGWLGGLIIGLVAGLAAGLLNIKFNTNPITSKVLSNLFAISGLLVGIMTGSLVNVYIFAHGFALCSGLFGLLFMVAAWNLGNKIGKQPEIKMHNGEEQFNLENPKLRHKLYQASLLVATIFLGYLSFGVLGYFLFPTVEIFVSQAIGTVVSSFVYLIGLTSYYNLVAVCTKIKDFIASFSSKNNKPDDNGAQQPPVVAPSVPVVPVRPVNQPVTAATAVGGLLTPEMLDHHVVPTHTP
jgi:hypothetical protein